MRLKEVLAEGVLDEGVRVEVMGGLEERMLQG